MDFVPAYLALSVLFIFVILYSSRDAAERVAWRTLPLDSLCGLLRWELAYRAYAPVERWTGGSIDFEGKTTIFCSFEIKEDYRILKNDLPFF